MLLLDARASMAMAPEVANIMARELKCGPAWIQTQITDYLALANGYILS